MTWNPQYHALRKWVKDYDEGNVKRIDLEHAKEELAQYPESMPQPSNAQLLRMILDLDARLTRQEPVAGIHVGQES